METAKDIADSLIKRAKDMQEFIIERELEQPPFFGYIPFDIKHVQGGPYQFKVHAVTKAEADEMVDTWLRHQEEDDL